MKQPIYLDYAAATPLDPAVFAAMQPYFSDKFYNPSALYLHARAVSQDIARARGAIAEWFGARPAELFFTAGGTEANNLAIKGIMEQHPDANLIVSAIEHESVLMPACHYAHKEAPVLKGGQVDLAQLEQLIDDSTVLISIMYANNEIGTIQPLKHVSRLIAQVRKQRQKAGIQLPIYLHTDACQAAAYLDLHVSRLGADLMTINGGKIYGPKQSGALYKGAHVEMAAQILGGGQEYGLRSGTENVPGIIGLAAALELVQRRRHEEVDRLQKLQKLFIDLLVENIPKATLNGSRKHRLPNNVHITLPGQDNERLVMILDEAGVLCAAGSACSASNEEPSHVLEAIGLSENDARASLRFTMGRATDEHAISQTVHKLKRSLS